MKGGKVAYQKRLYDEAIAAFVDAVLLKRTIMVNVSMADNKKATKARYHMYYLGITSSMYVTIAKWEAVPHDRLPVGSKYRSNPIMHGINPDEARELLELVKHKLRGK